MVYFDSSIWLSYLLGDRHQAKAAKLMERIDKGGDIALVSTLVMLEILEVIRKRITEAENYVGLTESAKRGIESKIKGKTREFIDKMTRLVGQGKAMLVDPDESLVDYFKKTLSLFLPYLGDVERFDYCFICRRRTAVRYRYRGLGHFDIQHAINARESSANEIASFDKAFSQLHKISGFDSLKVTVR